MCEPCCTTGFGVTVLQIAHGSALVRRHSMRAHTEEVLLGVGCLGGIDQHLDRRCTVLVVLEAIRWHRLQPRIGYAIILYLHIEFVQSSDWATNRFPATTTRSASGRLVRRRENPQREKEADG